MIFLGVAMARQPISQEDGDSMSKPPSAMISIVRSGMKSFLKITNPIENGRYLIKLEFPETNAELKYDLDRIDNALDLIVECMENENASLVHICSLHEGGWEAVMTTVDVSEFKRKKRPARRNALKTRICEYFMMMMIERKEQGT